MAATNRPIVVLEDNPLILLDMQTCLGDLGYANVFLASTLEDAARLMEENRDAVALLDVDIRGTPSFELAADLASKARRITFLTGYGSLLLPPELNAIPVLRKPVQINELEKAVKLLTDNT